MYSLRTSLRTRHSAVWGVARRLPIPAKRQRELDIQSFCGEIPRQTSFGLDGRDLFLQTTSYRAQVDVLRGLVAAESMVDKLPLRPSETFADGELKLGELSFEW